jgi:hypothetical protein
MEGVRCEFHEAGFSVRLATPEVGGATLNVPRLYAAVIPDQCTHTLSAGKLQLSLVKADASGAAWCVVYNVSCGCARPGSQSQGCRARFKRAAAL